MLSEQAYLEKNEPFSTLKTMISRKYSFQNLTQFLQRNNVPDAPASNKHAVLSTDTILSSN
jgi:hypothetical protein